VIDRDKMNHANPDAVAQSALAMLDTVSDHAPELQPVAFATAMVAFVKRTGHDMNHLFTVANNILHSKGAEGPAHRAIHLYMQHEIAR
jgi:hypothetical protein